MDAVTLALAKKYTDRICSVETTEYAAKWDTSIDPSKAAIFGANGFTYFQISDFVPSAKDLYGGSVIGVNGETTTNETITSLTDVGEGIINIGTGGMYGIVVTQPLVNGSVPAGIYMNTVFVDMGYTSCTIAWSTETIHPIEPKFLPGVDVIDLDEYGIDFKAIGMAGGGRVHVGDLSALRERIDKANKSFVLKIDLGYPSFIPYSGIHTEDDCVTTRGFNFEFSTDAFVNGNITRFTAEIFLVGGYVTVVIENIPIPNSGA